MLYVFVSNNVVYVRFGGRDPVKLGLEAIQASTLANIAQYRNPVCAAIAAHTVSVGGDTDTEFRFEPPQNVALAGLYVSVGDVGGEFMSSAEFGDLLDKILDVDVD